MARLRSDLALGGQFALASGSTRLRTALTAAGVAVGVALLLLAASVPHVLSARNARSHARQPVYALHAPLRAVDTDTTFHGTGITGLTMQAVGSGAAIPPGITHLPGPGEMDVSPALAGLLRGPRGAELRTRLHARVVGTIGPAGLSGPDDARFDRGAAHLGPATGASAVRAFGATGSSTDGGPLISLLVIVIVVALLLPVGVFVATAARFGAEDRDRRLAALRLVGADTLTTTRVALGEALIGALAGLIAGALVFVAARPLVPHLGIGGTSVFASDVQPSAWLAVLVAVLVPLSAVAATLLGIRRVAIEPLGASRRGVRSQRRLGWRLVAPVLGFVLLLPLIGSSSRLDTTGGELEAAAGVVLVLIGVTAVFPWLVEGIVRRAPDGPLPWLLAIRGLRSDEGTSGRVVGAIGLAVAGAIALQVLFGAAEAPGRQVGDSRLAQGTQIMSLAVGSDDGGAADLQRLQRTPGVTSVFGAATVITRRGTELATIASCTTIRQVTNVSDCHDGSSFVATGSGLRPGSSRPIGPRRRLHIPLGAHRVTESFTPVLPVAELLLTPGAARQLHLRGNRLDAVADLSSEPGAADRLRDRAAALDPYVQISTFGSSVDHTLVSLRHALFAGAVAVLAMIGASLLVAAGEQLRERRRALAVLAAVGTRRSTVAWSMLWQAAIPVTIGLALATGLGLGLGRVLTAIVSLSPSYDWGAIALMVAAGAAVIALVTLLTLPTLTKMMRPEALRVE
jgi:ABC-type antimicrobial peptide transport system permease subunit